VFLVPLDIRDIVCQGPEGAAGKFWRSSRSPGGREDHSLTVTVGNHYWCWQKIPETSCSDKVVAREDTVNSLP
jgi:hypothetical protein